MAPAIRQEQCQVEVTSASARNNRCSHSTPLHEERGVGDACRCLPELQCGIATSAHQPLGADASAPQRPETPPPRLELFQTLLDDLRGASSAPSQRAPERLDVAFLFDNDVVDRPRDCTRKVTERGTCNVLGL